MHFGQCPINLADFTTETNWTNLDFEIDRIKAKFVKFVKSPNLNQPEYIAQKIGVVSTSTYKYSTVPTVFAEDRIFSVTGFLFRI